MAKLLTGKTSAGFVYQVDPDSLNDMELLENLGNVEENPLVLPRVIRAVLGDSQKTAFYDHYRNAEGKVPVDVISAAFVEILSTNDQGKN